VFPETPAVLCAWQGKSVGSEDVQVADHEPLQGKVVVVVKVKLSAFVPIAVSWNPEGMP
jgi:hypothetical protein